MKYCSNNNGRFLTLLLLLVAQKGTINRDGGVDAAFFVPQTHYRSGSPPQHHHQQHHHHHHHQHQQNQRPSQSLLQSSEDNNGSRMELDNDEPLSLLFQRALVLQRAGAVDQALEEYQMFCKAAEQCQVDPSQYAEVHVNMGALYLKQGDAEEAKYHFDAALECRPNMGTAHVNLAVLQLQRASSSDTAYRQDGLECLRIAKEHCQKAVASSTDDDNDNDDANDTRTVDTAKRLLGDIERMLQQAGEIS